MNYILWQYSGGKFVDLTGPVPLAEAERMRDACLASIRDFEYKIAPVGQQP